MTWEGLSPPYSTIVADPPWPYVNNRGTQTRSRRGRAAVTAEGNYSTLGLIEMALLPVGDLAAKDSHCYIWATNPLLAEGLSLMRAWGFKYVTTLTWHKTGAPGLGFSFRVDTEHVLFGRRGCTPIPPEKRESNHFTAKRCGHSRKPAAFFDIVERVSPGPYLELFARQPRLGWDSWGYGYESANA